MSHLVTTILLFVTASASLVFLLRRHELYSSPARERMDYKQNLPSLLAKHLPPSDTELFILHGGR